MVGCVSLNILFVLNIDEFMSEEITFTNKGDESRIIYGKRMCGILGLIVAEGIAPGDLAYIAVDALTSLQHRGTESSGLVGTNGIHKNYFEIAKGCGLVKDCYTNESLNKFVESVAVLGHNRYSTAGMKGAINCVQPFVVHTAVGLIAIAHNGELVDAKQRREEVLNAGVGLSTDTDSELIAQLISKSVAINLKCRELAVTMSSLRMSYSLLVMTYDRIYALRDPYGNRPLCVGTLYSSTQYDPRKEKGILYCVAPTVTLFETAVIYSSMSEVIVLSGTILGRMKSYRVC
uniref:Glutamine amidotransferase type-2 domain-containing protein n=1 Tax=Parascaris equorum TaxID=6256 RepID=A0A914R7J7_PAREQ